MSSGPTLVGENWRSIRRTNISIDEHSWCSYHGVCYKDFDNNTNGNKYELCFICKWCVPINIPEMIEEARNVRDRVQDD